MDILTGKILGNRYELLEEIGFGGMAQVYKAKCRLLNRFVAVKILRSEFASDEEFLTRFNAEAQAAAALSHHNIVSIYDVGSEDGIKYIVMEYVEGVTLKDYIIRNTMLPWRQAVDFAIQICTALNCAHKNGIVHRDIKPQNIILTSDGVLKVTDFGIARAVSTSSVTITGNTMGSVHYLSPEQARGGYTDAKSDIYSLGIVLYEMVTGRLPFDGDNPVTIAIKQIQEKPVSPKEYNLAVPLAIESVIMRAMNKDQNNRFPSALDMLSCLKMAKENPNAELKESSMPGGDATRKIEAIKPEDLLNHTAKKAPERPLTEKIEIKKEKPIPTDKKRPADEKSEKKAVIWAVVTSALIVTLLVIGTLAVLFPDMFNGSGAKEISVPALVGESYETVKDLYAEQGITIELVRTEKSSEHAMGIITDQDPKEGRKRKPPVTISVTVSGGTEEFVLDNYEKKDFIKVKIALEDKDIIVEEVEQESDIIAEGMIVKTVPAANTVMQPGDKVTIYVSAGVKEKPVLVPRLVDLDVQQARKILSENNLSEEINEVYDERAKGTVIAQSVPANTEVKEYSTVTLTVSRGPQPKSRPVTIGIPQDKDSTAIKLVQDGVVIYEKTHNASEGQYFDVTISGNGTVTLELYYDGAFSNTLTVNL